MKWTDYIERNPSVMMGKPVFKGTRLTVEHILNRLGDGWSEADLFDSYPQLTVRHLRAAQLYAAEAIGHDDLLEVHETGS